MKKPILGKVGNKSQYIDVQRLLETRLLVQANSGGGKSWALRRLLEQTANHVQQIVIDPEGEFATLREKYDYIIAAPHDGDAEASPRTAKLMARRLLETGVSAIIDIYDLKAHERHSFVKLFLDSLVNAPRKLWRPALVVLDEAHMFAPEKGKAESTGSVIDIATRGRKRGLCLIAATQRLSKLHKDVAAECINKLVGRTGLDVDVKRAADELGMTAREAMAALRGLNEGEFFIFGPAFTKKVEKVKVGNVSTTHPKAGSRFMKAPPAPSAKVKKILGQLGDLPKEAAQEATTTTDLKKEVTRLRRELTVAQKTGGGISEKEVQKRIDVAITAATKNVLRQSEGIERALAQIDSTTTAALKKYGLACYAPIARPKLDQPSQQARHRLDSIKVNNSGPMSTKLRAGAIRILRELASRYPAGYSKQQVGVLTKFSHKGGTFSTYMSDLRKAGYIEENDKLIYATEDGIREVGDDVPATPNTHEEVMALWRKALRSGAYRILEVIVHAGNGGIQKEVIAEAMDMAVGGGTFSTYLSDLHRNGLVTKSGSNFTACDILYP